MTTLEKSLKNLVPNQAKDAAKGAIRGYGSLTATWRSSTVRYWASSSRASRWNSAGGVPSLVR